MGFLGGLVKSLVASKVGEEIYKRNKEPIDKALNTSIEAGKKVGSKAKELYDEYEVGDKLKTASSKVMEEVNKIRGEESSYEVKVEDFEEEETNKDKTEGDKND